MRLHRFYIPQKTDIFLETNAEFVVHADLYRGKELLHQWRDIFRYVTGDRLFLYNEKFGQWLCEFVSIDKKRGACLRVIQKDITHEFVLPKTQTVLYMSVIKNTNFDLVVEKTTELGVNEIVPIKTVRTIKKDLNFSRLQKLAMESSEQSGRIDVPFIREKIIDLKDAVVEVMDKKYVNYNQIVYFGHIGNHITNIENVIDNNIKKHQNDNLQINHKIDDTGLIIKNVNKNKKEKKVGEVIQKIIVFIGPEGGWVPEEVELFERSGVLPILLGRFVLRAETAAISALSILNR